MRGKLSAHPEHVFLVARVTEFHHYTTQVMLVAENSVSGCLIVGPHQLRDRDQWEPTESMSCTTTEFTCASFRAWLGGHGWRLWV